MGRNRPVLRRWKRFHAGRRAVLSRFDSTHSREAAHDLVKEDTSSNCTSLAARELVWKPKCTKHIASGQSNQGYGFVIERRRRTRVALHWRVFLSRSGEEVAIESVTSNASSGGFFCECTEAVTPGEDLDCMMLIPVFSRAYSEAALRLNCQVRVVHADMDADGRTRGIGCRITNYSVILPVEESCREAAAIEAV